MINRVAMAVFGLWWPLQSVGQSAVDPTQPPVIPPKEEGETSHCVSMAFVASDRQVAIVDGQRLRLGDALGKSVVHKISAHGVVLERNGKLNLFPTGNCPSTPIPQTNE